MTTSSCRRCHRLQLLRLRTAAVQRRLGTCRRVDAVDSLNFEDRSSWFAVRRMRLLHDDPPKRPSQAAGAYCVTQGLRSPRLSPPVDLKRRWDHAFALGPSQRLEVKLAKCREGCI